MRQKTRGLARVHAIVKRAAQVPASYAGFPVAISTEMITRLRSRGDNSDRFHTSPNSTSSVRLARPGAIRC